MHIWLDALSRPTSRTHSTSIPGRKNGTAGRATITLAALAVVSGLSLTACFPNQTDSVNQSSSNSGNAQNPSAESSLTGNGTDQTQGLDENQCATKSLELTTTTPESGAGSRFFDVKFTNKGDKPCELKGFPGVSLVTDNNGTQLGTSAAREDNVEYKPVTLDKGQSATAAVRLTSTGPLDPNECKPATADGIRVYPPGETNSAFIPMKDVEGCSGNVSVLSVQPVTAEG